MRNRGILPYIARRLLLLVPMAFAVTAVVFLLQSLIPGGPIAALLQGHATDTASIEAMKVKFGLDKPLYEQYWDWVLGVFRGDLGTSIYTSQSVTQSIGERLGVTLLINGIGMLLCFCVGIPMGIAAAYKRGGPLDRFIVSINVFWSSAPHFVIAIVVLFLFGYQLRWFPIFGLGSGSGIDLAWHLVLPTFVVSLGPLAFITRLTRASVLENLSEDYVTFARARGLGFWTVLGKYALRNSLVPILTGVGLVLVGLLTGAVFVELVFGIPGLGSLLVNAVTNNDFPVVQGLVLIISGFIIAANLLIDLCYPLVDPRMDFVKAQR